MAQRLEDDDETTSVELQTLIAQKFGATVRRHVQVSLQWTVVRTRYDPVISAANQ